MYPIAVESALAEVRQKYSQVICFEGPSLDGEGLFYVICRALNLSEFEYYRTVSLRCEDSAMEFVCNQAVLGVFLSSSNAFVPTNELPLGLYRDAHNIIIGNSGFSPEGLMSSINEFRALGAAAHLQAIAFIARAFPSLTPRDIEAMSSREVGKHIALAEIIFAAQGFENPYFNITTGEEKVNTNTEKSNVLRSIAKQARENDKILGKKTINPLVENRQQASMG